jgi:uncharacterized protein
MKLTIHSISNSGEINIRLWDNRTCDFLDISGGKIDVSIDIPDDERERIKQEGHEQVACCSSDGSCVSQEAMAAYMQRVRFPKTTKTKDRNITSLRIQMGMACNYSCQYCKQATHHKYDHHATMTDTENFIANFADICTTDRAEPINIQLWGGEPLLYWSVLTRLGEFFRKEFPFARITVLSNGSIMSLEKADWFLDNNVILAVSHDGPGQLDYRTGDCLVEGSESLVALRYYAKKSKEPLYFNAVITKGRYDLVGIKKYIESKFEGNIRVGFEGIVLVEDETQFDETTMFTEQDYLELRKSVLKQLLSGELNKVGMFRAKINALLSAVVIDKYDVPIDTQQKCSMDSPYNVSVDLKGNILACHSTPKPIGHVSDFPGATLERIGFVHWSERPECLSCPVLSLCRGGCLAQDATAFYHSCQNEFHFHMIFFEAVFRLLFGESILSIEGVERPTKIDFLRRYQNEV